jgi:prolyl-tRNA synthetase
VVSPLARAFTHSYKDLPFSVYQIQTKFRSEARAKSGVMRGREFLMKDLYSFHRDQACLDAFYERVQGAYDRVWQRLGLAEVTALTYASGGSFSQYSHEYQVITPAGEDTIYISEDAEAKGQRVAINKEIYEPGQTVCPVTGGTRFREVRACEVGNIFKLGTKFSAPFKLQVTGEDGQVQPVLMGCYGIGVSRLMGVIVEAFADEAGLRWPAQVAPAQWHIVPIAKTPEEDGYTRAFELYHSLLQRGIPALFDDRLHLSTGHRLADADLLGLPKRALVSPKSLQAGGAEVKLRATGEVQILPLTSIGI